ncbi:hypothetical protein FHT78_001118 [Rhizobium sp. BK196]|nr:hypothetical protein [Rhizobium sp. BK196]
MPSGRVTLAVEELSILPEPAEELDADDDAEVDDPVPVVVDDVTLPFPAVTVVDMSPEADFPSITVHVDPSSSLISSAPACAAMSRAAPYMSDFVA